MHVSSFLISWNVASSCQSLEEARIEMPIAVIWLTCCIWWWLYPWQSSANSAWLCNDARWEREWREDRGWRDHMKVAGKVGMEIRKRLKLPRKTEKRCFPTCFHGYHSTNKNGGFSTRKAQLYGYFVIKWSSATIVPKRVLSSLERITCWFIFFFRFVSWSSSPFASIFSFNFVSASNFSRISDSASIFEASCSMSPSKFAACSFSRNIVWKRKKISYWNCHISWGEWKFSDFGANLEKGTRFFKKMQ